MASVAVGKVGGPEGSFVVMAGSATLRFPGCLMEDHHRFGNLVFARAGPKRVALAAAHPFMTSVAEASHVIRGRVNGSRVTRFVACVAGIDVVSVLGHFCGDRGLGTMALQTSRVSVRPGRHGESLTALSRLMACGAVRLRSVLRVIEFCVEGRQARELLHCPARRIGVADRAHPAAFRIFEVLHVAADTRRVV